MPTRISGRRPRLYGRCGLPNKSWPIANGALRETHTTHPISLQQLQELDYDLYQVACYKSYQEWVGNKLRRMVVDATGAAGSGMKDFAGPNVEVMML